VAVELWPSVGEYGVYDGFVYRAMTEDAVRNAAFEAAIASQAHGRIAVDVGTGADAVLALMCARAGARHVYALEALESAAESARAAVRAAGMESRVSVLTGDARSATLPEPAGLCVAELIGSIGSAEGVLPVLEATRHLLAANAVWIPGSCVTRIAAVSLPAELSTDPRLSPLAEHYARRIHEQEGGVFDLRLCLTYVDNAMIASSTGVFEELVLCPPARRDEATWETALHIEEERSVDGFVLWVEVGIGEGTVSSRDPRCTSWLPAFLPALPPGVRLPAGSVVELSIRTVYRDQLPDYEIAGCIRAGGERREFTYVSARTGARQPSGLPALIRCALTEDRLASERPL
jgi:protein arginine N-methyltransferase 1